MFARVAQLSTTDATTLLTAALNGYKLEAKDAMGIVDMFSAVDLIAATSAQELGRAYQYVAASAASAGLDQEKLTGLIAVGSETTRLSAETIGNAWKTLIARMQNIKVGNFIDDSTGEALNDVEKVLNNLGIRLRDDADTWRDVGEVVDEVGQKWSSFTDIERSAISTAMAGVRQANVLSATFENYGNVLEYTEVAQNAAGTTAEKYAHIIDSVDYKVNEFKESIVGMWNGLMDGGTIGAFVEMGTGLVKTLELISNLLTKTPIGMVLLTKVLYTVGSATKGAVLESNLYKQALASITSEGSKLSKIQDWYLGVNNATKTTKAETDALKASVEGLIVSYDKLGSAGKVVGRVRATSPNPTGSSTSSVALPITPTIVPPTTDATKTSAWKKLGDGIGQNTGMAITAGITTALMSYSTSKQAADSSEAIASGLSNVIGGALQGFMVSGGNPIGAAIGGGLSLVTSAIGWIAGETERASERATEAITKFKEATRDFSEQSNSIDSLVQKYAILSKGVGQMGEVVGLSKDEYEEYLSVVQDIADINPELVSKWDEQGNAIALVTSNTTSLTTALNDYLKMQKEVADNEYLAQSGDIFKKAKKDTEELRKEYEDLEALLNQDGVKIRTEETLSLADRYGLSTDFFADAMGGGTISIDFSSMTDQAAEKIKSDLENLSRKIENEYSDFRSTLITYINKNSDFSNETSFNINSIVQGLNFREMDFANDDIAQEWVRVNLIDPLSDPSTQAQFNNAVSRLLTNESLNLEGSISFNDFQETLSKASEDLWYSFGADSHKAFEEAGMNAENFAARTGFSKIGQDVDALNQKISNLFAQEGTYDRGVIGEVNYQSLQKMMHYIDQSGAKISDFQTVLGWLGSKGVASLNTIMSKLDNTSQVSITETNNAISKLLSTIPAETPEAVSALNMFKQALYVDNSNLYDMSDAIDSMLGKMKTFSDAIKDVTAVYEKMLSGEDIDFDTTMSLITQYPDLMKTAYTDSNGAIRLNIDSVKELMQTQEQALKDEFQKDHAEAQARIAELDTNIKILSVRTALSVVDRQRLDNLKAEKERLEGILPALENGLNFDITRAQKAAERAAALKKLAEAEAKAAKDRQKAYDDYNDKAAKAEDDRQKAIDDYNKSVQDVIDKLEELAKKDHFEKLSDSVDFVKLKIDQLNKTLDTLNFKLEITDSTDYATRINTLATQFQTATQLGKELSAEFERMATIQPQSAEESALLASRVKELGAEIRTNLTSLREFTTELTRLRIESITSTTSNAVKMLEAELSLLDYNLQKITDGSLFESSSPNNFAFAFDFMIPQTPESALEKKRKENEELIKEQQRLNDEIFRLQQRALEMETAENQKHRDKEKADLEQSLLDLRDNLNKKLADIRKTLDDAERALRDKLQDIQNSVDDIKVGIDWDVDPDELQNKLDRNKPTQTVRVEYDTVSSWMQTAGSSPVSHLQRWNGFKDGNTSVDFKAAGGKIQPYDVVYAGEEGYEYALLPNGQIVMLGTNGAQFYDLPANTRIINHQDSKEATKYNPNLTGTKVKSFKSGNTDVSFKASGDLNLSQYTNPANAYSRAFMSEYLNYSQQRQAQMNIINALKEQMKYVDKLSTTYQALQKQVANLTDEQLNKDIRQNFKMQIDSIEATGKVLSQSYSELFRMYQNALNSGASYDDLNAYQEALASVQKQMMETDAKYLETAKNYANLIKTSSVAYKEIQELNKERELYGEFESAKLLTNLNAQIKDHSQIKKLLQEEIDLLESKQTLNAAERLQLQSLRDELHATNKEQKNILDELAAYYENQKQEQYKATSDIEKKIVAMLKNSVDKQKQLQRDYTNAYIKELDRQRDADNYEKTFDKERNELLRIQNEITNLSRSTDIGDRNAVAELWKQEAAQRAKLEEMANERTFNERKELLQAEMDMQEKFLDEKYSGENLLNIARQLLLGGEDTDMSVFGEDLGKALVEIREQLKLGDNEILTMTDAMGAYFRETSSSLTEANKEMEVFNNNLSTAIQMIATLGYINTDGTFGFKESSHNNPLGLADDDFLKLLYNMKDLAGNNLSSSDRKRLESENAALIKKSPSADAAQYMTYEELAKFVDSSERAFAKMTADELSRYLENKLNIEGGISLASSEKENEALRRQYGIIADDFTTDMLKNLLNVKKLSSDWMTEFFGTSLNDLLSNTSIASAAVPNMLSALGAPQTTNANKTNNISVSLTQNINGAKATPEAIADTAIDGISKTLTRIGTNN